MSGFSGFDHACMAEALRLAERGLFTTRPNPRVGCVLARDGAIIGRGFHRRAGEPHAEVFALAEAAAAASGATAYVTLEPCAHHGRTPPCADALIAAGVQRVVVATRDPFPQVDGRGIERLRGAGIAVELGLLETPARELNVGFFARIERGRPWLRLKLAASLDGRSALASGESQWITGAAARADVQQWRARACAILSGAASVRRDNPRLTARVEAAVEPPARVIVCGREGVPIGASLLTDRLAPVWLAGPAELLPGPSAHYHRIALPASAAGVDLRVLLTELAARGINEVHAETGPRLAGALLAAGLVDELLLYQAPCLLGAGGLPLLAGNDPAELARRLRFDVQDSRWLGPDLRLRLRPLAAAAAPASP